MPRIDARTGEVVIRIVYDGAPEAGKTTNVHQLSGQISLQRRGAALSPGTTGERTEFFDWLDFSGGYLDGRRVRCQLVSVPGQQRLLHRRRYLLETADAIVFVADSRPETFAQAMENFAATIRILERVDQGIPVGLILQANKQDLPGALPPEAVLEALALPAGTPVVASAAANGDGVMQCFVLAVRLATNRVRTLIMRDPLADLPMTGETPEGLHAAMVQLDESEAAAAQAASAAAQESPAAPEAALAAAQESPAVPGEASAAPQEAFAAAQEAFAAVQAASAAPEEAPAAPQEAFAAPEEERASADALPEVFEQDTEAVIVEFDIDVGSEGTSMSLVEDAAAPVENALASADDAPVPVDNAAAPVENALASTEGAMTPAGDASAPAEDALASADDAAAPVENAAAPAEDAAAPAEDVPGPVQFVRRNLLARAEDVELPKAQEIASGGVWPPVKGRATFAEATAGTLTVPEVVQPWAPAGALELVNGEGWYLHSSDRWVFDNEGDARLRLITLIRRLVTQLELLPEERALAVSRDGAHWRLWLATRSGPAIGAAAQAALCSDGIEAVGTFVGQAMAALQRLRGLGIGEVPGGASGVALEAGRAVILALDEGEPSGLAPAGDPLDELAALVTRHAQERRELTAWFERIGQKLVARVSSSTVG